MVSGLGAHASSVLLVTISGHISVQLRYSNGINWHAGSVRSQAKTVLQRQANVRIRFEGAALASNGSTGLFVYKGVGNCHASHMRIMGELHEKIRYRIYEIEY